MSGPRRMRRDASDRLPLRAKPAYVVQLRRGGATQSRSLFLVYFYTEANDYLSAVAVGAIPTLARLLETDDGADRVLERQDAVALRPQWSWFIVLATPFLRCSRSSSSRHLSLGGGRGRRTCSSWSSSTFSRRRCRAGPMRPAGDRAAG